MIKLLFLILPLFFLTACINKRGISTKYYNKCREYYDYQGVYHKTCDENEVLEYESIKKIPKKVGKLFEEKKTPPNVW